MDPKTSDPANMTKDELIRVAGMFFEDVLVHYGLWFSEAVRQSGIEAALALESRVMERYFPLAAARIAPHLGLEMDGNIPKVLASKSKEELLLLVADIAKTWLTSDGLWFQALESTAGMAAAKEANDTCWSHFALMEAFKIKKYLGLGDNGGLEALETSLNLRVYSTINAHSASWDSDGTLLFSMTECRVQAARRRKGLEEYACKSAGIVEYSNFARGIDPRIRTDCVWCPPDRVPDEAFCTWRFSLEP
jgi:hypothetical protein